ncbi:serine/threonine protein kinase [Kibdelosporangium philippinense]|uniref:non-specific serine/threonine protein kinase n=1 Tax=Kibdelosporangium philippinense TaxID=211113 RepID=A0ABS8ZEL1_9PSEU|nr:serine/threonine-protein kinase [Kibdelosporangium philippinense]MCE7005987.1 serine/threonine protein kinase [Kibdelosporangium philippinense]
MPSDEDRLVAGRYRLGQRIGSGAMGVVWQAQDDRLHRTVAVKQLLTQPGLSAAQAEEGRLRSMREGRIAARLQHPNAITVYDVVEDDGQPWLVMEYLPSRSLAAELDDRGTIPPQEAARIGAEVASGLVAAHAAGIVHRDIKPANVLLGNDNSVKITDFGISRAVGDVTVTATGMLAGTPAYLAPEVAKGMEPTPASDVFSLGSTLYICVEGHSPFGLSENTLALLHAVAAGKISPPRQAGPLTALLMRLLRTEPEERPTMAAAKEALAAIAAGRPVQPGLVSGNYDGPTVAQRIQAPMPPQPVMQQPTNHPATRIDANPLAEPRRTPPSGFQMGPPPPGTPPRGNQPPIGPPPPRREQMSAEPRQNRDVRKIVLTVLAIIGAAAVGVLVASLFTSKTPNAQPNPTTLPPPPPATVTQTGPPTVKKSTTTPPPSSSSAPPSSSTQDDDSEQLEDASNFVEAYYDLLPENPEAGWALLTPKAQALSQGKDGYFSFYAEMEDVRITDVSDDGKGNVRGTVRFKKKDGSETRDPYRFTVVVVNGKLMIDDFKLGST